MASRVFIRKSVCVLFIILCSITTHPALAKETLEWRVTHWPPFYILEGPNKGQGIYDEIITLLIENLPEYEHKRVVASTRRVVEEWKRGNKICHASMVPSEQASYSVINAIIPSLRILVHKDKTHLFKGDTLSLRPLLADTRLVGGITPGQYTPRINRVVNEFHDAEHLVKSTRYDCLLRMLFENRIDYVIEYPVVADFVAEEVCATNKTVSYKITEFEENPFSASVVSCPPTDWGWELIRKIDAILIRESKKPGFLDSRLRWYKGRERQELQKLYDTFYFHDKQ